MKAPRVVFVLLLAVYTFVFVTRGVRDPGAADGFYSYLYARSLAYDGDVSFANDYAVCGDPYGQGIVRGAGPRDNPGHPGPALFWTPVVLAARALVRHDPGAPADVRAGCRGPVAQAALVTAMPLAALAMALAFASARRFTSTGAAGLAAFAFGLASSLPQYAAVFVSSSHVHECFAAALVMWTSLRAHEQWSSSSRSLGPFVWVGVACAVATLMRASDAALVAVPLALVVREGGRRARKLAACGVVLGGAVVGFAALCALYTYLYGSPFVLPQGRHYVFPLHAHPWLVLFAPHGGLFYATPVAWTAVVGIVIALRRDDEVLRTLVAAGVVATVACLFVAASALDWHGKATFGARRLVVLTPLFVVFAAVAFDAVAQRMSPWVARGLGAAMLLGCAVPVIVGVMGTTTGATPLDDAPTRSSFGVWPAQLFFSARFGLPPRAFRAATLSKFYRRSYRDLSWEPNTLDFRDAVLRDASRGLAPTPVGMRLTGTDAKIVFAAGWPVATDARLIAQADTKVKLAFDIGTTFTRCPLGVQEVGPGTTTLHFVVPPRCFDSGLVELSFHGSPGVVLEKLVLDDTRALPPPF